MDGAALLNLLSDWTPESHPNVSEARRNENNALMAELRTEIFSLLTPTQTGGGNAIESGMENISFSQEIDENIVRNMTAEELEAQIGGKLFAEKRKLGLWKWLKIATGIRDFNNFIEDFELLRLSINRKLSGYEAQAERAKTLIDEMIVTLKHIFLYKKEQTMWDIIKNEKDVQRLNFKRELFNERISRTSLEIDRLEIKLKQQTKSAKSIFNIKNPITKDWMEKGGIGFDFGFISFKKYNFVDKLIHQTMEQIHEYKKLYKELNYYTNKMEKVNQIKILEAKVANKKANDLTKQQRKQLAKYQKNRAKYEKMNAFNQNKRQEYNQLLIKKENLVASLEYMKEALITSLYLGGDRQKMDKALTEWQGLIKKVYENISQIIEKSKFYKDQIKILCDLVFDNGNNISKLISGMVEFEDIKKEYDKYLENCNKTKDIQELIHNTLNEIKNKFIKLVPDKNLLPDMFNVVSGQSMLLGMVDRVLLETQVKLGVDEMKGRKFLEDKILNMKGGSNEIEFNNQEGGYFLEFLDERYEPEHGRAFYEHNNSGDVFDLTRNDYVRLPTAPGRTNVDILTLPYGVRQITDDFYKYLDRAINKIENNKHIYLPIWKYGDKQNKVYVFTATYDRINQIYQFTSEPVIIESKAYMTYQLIYGDYYFFNIMENPDNTNSSTAFSNFENTADSLKININGEKFMLLPVFYRMNYVKNKLFEYPEYIMLHPFLGGAMVALLKESYLNRRNINDYDFDDTNQLKFDLKIQKEPTNNTDEFDDYNYYYNFCGTNIEIKNGPSAAEPLYYSLKHSNKNIGVTMNPCRSSNLQPMNIIKINTLNNRAIYANFILQLTGHINELVTKIREIKVEPILTTTPPTWNINPQFADNNPYTDFSNYNYNYELVNPPSASQKLPQELRTILAQIGPDKTWSEKYVENLFDINPSNQEAVGTLLMKIHILFEPILKNLQNGTSVIPSGNSTVSNILTGNTSTSTVGLGPGNINNAKLLDPRVRKRMDFLKNNIDSTSDYWQNLTKITTILKLFSSNDFLDYNQMIMQTYDEMQKIRKIEDNILKIDFKSTDEFLLPENNLIVKELENIPPPNSPNAYTNAGQKLYDQLKQDRGYIDRISAAVGSSNLIRDLDDLFHEIYRNTNVNDLIRGTTTITFFTTSPGDQYKAYLQTKEGATELIRQLENNKNYNNKDILAKICFYIEFILGITSSTNPDAFAVYERYTQDFRSKLNQNKNKNKNKNKNRNRGQTNTGNTGP